MFIILFCSKNSATSSGIANIICNLSYNPCIEEVNLSDMASVSSARDDKLNNALAKLFTLTVSLKKVGVCICVGVSNVHCAKYCITYTMYMYIMVYIHW